jgi:hypothetical protein
MSTTENETYSANPNQKVYDTAHQVDHLVEVVDIYFAEKIPKFKLETKEEEYTIGNKGTIEDVAKKYEKTTRINITVTPIGETKITYTKGDKLMVRWEEKIEDGFDYPKINQTSIKKKVFVVAICNGSSGKLSIELHENKLDNTEAVYDNPIIFLIGEDEKTKIEFSLDGSVQYTQEIILRPKSDEDLKLLVDKFQKREKKNAFLYFKAEVTNTEDEIKYSGDSPEFLNQNNQRFEILGTPCYCNRDITIDEMIDLIYFLRDKQNYKSKKEAFFNRGSEYISSIRISDGKISENKDKVELFVNEMNAMFEKFNIKTCKRKIHFLGQMYLETISFQYTYESRTEVPDNYKGGVDFQGRGMKQITHDYNYLAYYDYYNNTNLFSNVYMVYRSGYESVGECAKNRKKAQENGLDEAFYETLKTFAKNISQDLFHAFNSAGWFSTVYKTQTITAMDEGLEDSNIESVTKAINGGLNNIAERKDYTKWAKEFFKYDTECVNK